MVSAAVQTRAKRELARDRRGQGRLLRRWLLVALAAGLTTALVLTSLMIPLSLGTVLAARQMYSLAGRVLKDAEWNEMFGAVNDRLKLHQWQVWLHEVTGDPVTDEDQIEQELRDRLRTVAYSYFEHNPDAAVLPDLLAALDREQAEFVRGGARPGRLAEAERQFRPVEEPPKDLRVADIKRENPRLPDVIAGGAANNPMGAAALVLNGGQDAIHGTNNPGSIGGFVSHACIRMYNQDITELYDRVGVGTPVIVTR